MANWIIKYVNIFLIFFGKRCCRVGARVHEYRGPCVHLVGRRSSCDAPLLRPTDAWPPTLVHSRPCTRAPTALYCTCAPPILLHIFTRATRPLPCPTRAPSALHSYYSRASPATDPFPTDATPHVFRLFASISPKMGEGRGGVIRPPPLRMPQTALFI